MRISILVLALLASGCNSTIYGRDGVTDGDTFYLAPVAMASQDPVLQSWVRYGLAKSVCQLELGGDIPSRSTSFDCELTARRHLVEAWDEKIAINHNLSDEYLDSLRDVSEAGLLAEYISHYLGRRHWTLPEGLRMAEFHSFRRSHLRRHKPETRLIGYWGYAE